MKREISRNDQCDYVRPLQGFNLLDYNFKILHFKPWKTFGIKCYPENV